MILVLLSGAVSSSANVRTLVNEGRAALRLQTTSGLQQAEAKFSAALQAAPSDHEANLLHAAVVLVREQGKSDFTTLLDGLGIGIVNNDPYNLEYVLPTDAEDRFKPRDGTRTESTVTYARSKEGLINGALSSLAKINSENFLVQLSAEETSSTPVRLDLADIRVLRAFLHLAKGALAASESYNLSAEYALFYRLVAGGNLDPKSVSESLPRALEFSATPQARSKIKSSAATALDELQKAIAFIRTKRAAPNGTPFLFELEDDESAAAAAREFEALARALDGPVDLPVDERSLLFGQKVDLRSLFTSSRSPRSFLSSTYDRGFYRPGYWPDPTLGGILPQATQQVIDRLALESGVLQDTLYEPYEFRPMAEGAFEEISGIAADANGNLYVADRRRNVICKISIDGKMAIVAGRPWTHDWEKRRLLYEGFSGDREWIDEEYVFSLPNSKATDVLENLQGITADHLGHIYFVSNRRVMRLDAVSGRLTLLAGNPGDQWWLNNDARDGTGSDARFRYPEQLFCDAAGNVYVCDGNALRKITPSGRVTTVAGRLGWSESGGYKDGPSNQALLEHLGGGAMDRNGSIYLADSGNGAIRKMDPAQSVVETLAGGPRAPGMHYDAVAARAGLGWIVGMAVDAEKNIYFSDGSTVRKFQATTGRVVTLGGRPTGKGIAAGIGENALLGDSWDTRFRFLTIDPRGTLYAANKDGFIMRARSVVSAPSGTPLPTPTPYPQPPSGAPSGPPWPQVPAAGDELPAAEFFSLAATPSTLEVGAKEGIVFLRGSYAGGWDYLNLTFRHEASGQTIGSYMSGNRHPTAPVEAQRMFEKKIFIPVDAPRGRWKISQVYGNGFYYSEYSGSIPAPFAGLGFEITGSPATPPLPQDDDSNDLQPWPDDDSRAPEVLDVEFVPALVEVSGSSAPIKLRLTLRDASGVDYVNGNLSPWVPWPRGLWFGDGRLVSGNEQEGVFEFDVRVPMQSAAGAWGISWLEVTDVHGNRADLNRWDGTLPAVVEQKYLTVNLNSGPILPEIKSLVLGFPGGSSIIDTESGEAEVRVRLRVVDKTSEERDDWWPPNGHIGIRSPSGTQYLWSDFTEAHRIGGTRADGTYEIVFRLPQYSEQGVWAVDYVQLDDANYQSVYYSAVDLVYAGIAAPVFAVTGASRKWDVQQLSLPPPRNTVALRLDSVSFINDGAEKFAAALSPDRPDLNERIVLTYNGLTTAPVDPGVYEVRAFLGSDDAEGRASGTLTITGFVPSVRITAQPQPITAYNGETVSFSVSATGQAPLTYQWLYQAKAVGRATTNNALTVKASAKTAGSYSVRVSNSLGSLTSAEAILTLRPAAGWQWASDSTNAAYVREVGQSVSFGVTNITGPAASPIAYQWQRDGANLAGATNARIALANLALEQAGAYRLRISTSAGFVLTDNKRLEVRDRGVLVYAMTGQSSYAVSSDPRAQRNSVAAFVVVDRDAAPQGVWFVWYNPSKSGPKTFWVEERKDAAFDASASAAGALAVITAADIPEGASSGRDKDVVWFTGTNSLVRFRSPVPRSALAPLRLQGLANRLDIANGVRIEVIDGAMNLEQDLTLRARNANESGVQALQRVRTKLVSEGFVESGAP